MHDLNTLNRLNLEAHGASIKASQDAGKYVVATYTGLTLYSTAEFDNEDAALRAQKEPAESPDINRRLFAPTTS